MFQFHRWFKDSVGISKTDAKYQQIDHPEGLCELIVNTPNNADSGKYVCKAHNRAGNSEISHYVLYEGKAAHIAENSHGVYHADHGPLERAKSEARGVLSGGNADGENKDEDDKDNKDKGGRGRGGGGRADSSAAPSVAPPPVKKLPRDARIVIHFATKLSNRVVAEGSKVKLTCYVEGADPFIRWFKEDQPVVFSPKCRQNNNHGLCILELTSPTLADAGVYKCYARNDSGETETTCKLEVYTKGDSADLTPTFTRSLKDVYHSNLNEISLSCHVRGMPTPTITWVKDGVTVEPSEKYQLVENDDGTVELIVSDVTTQDSGKYVCQAESRAGTAEISHLVQVQARSQRNSIPTPRKTSLKDVPGTPNNEEAKEGDAEAAGGKGKGQRKRPSVQSNSGGGGGGRRYVPPPVDPKTQLFFVAFLTDRTVSEGGKTKLSCYIQGPDPNIKWYKGENPIVFSPRCRAELRDGLCTLTLTNLTKDDTGEYRVCARNQFSEITTQCNLSVYEAIKQVGEAPVFAHSIRGVGPLLFCVLCRIKRLAGS